MQKIQLGNDIELLQVGNDYQIAGLLFSGRGKTFAVTLPHKHDDVYEPIDQLALSKDELEKFLFQLDTLSTKVLTLGDDGDLVKAVVRKSQRQIDNVIQWQVFDRDNYTCRYCGRKGIPMSIDHIIVWEDGGATVADNLLTACKSCNRDRGNTPYVDWLNSRFYQQKSKHLPETVKNANLAVALDIPRLESLKTIHKRSR